MPVTIKMPALSPTMTEGKIASWLKKEGDEVRAGDVIAEIETDKATMEVEAVDEGTLGKILSPEGADHVAVNAPIAVLLEEGEGKDALDAAVKAAESAAKAAPAPEKEAAKEKAAAPAKAEEKPGPEKAAPAPAPRPAAPKPAPAPAAPGGRIFASPLARRMAGEAGIELALLAGSGPHGRIVKADVEDAIAAGGARALGGGIHAGLGQSFAPAATRLAPHSTMRKVIAERLAQSKRTVPHFYATIDCEIDALLALRKEINDTDESLNVSVNDFVVRASALALREVPDANVSWSDDGMVAYAGCDVAVAVATDAGGLITPIVRAAERKGVAAISVEMKDLAARARAGKLAPEEYQGGSFTVSNMGMFGVREFAAIINPPQACILAVGAGEQRAVVHDGEIAVATVMSVTLSCDHRAVDGAVGARLLAAFKQLVEHPVRLIL